MKSCSSILQRGAVIRVIDVQNSCCVDFKLCIGEGNRHLSVIDSLVTRLSINCYLNVEALSIDDFVNYFLLKK